VSLSDESLEYLFETSFKETRAARVGAVNLNTKTPKEMVIEGAENFRTDSDPPVATYSGGKSNPFGGSNYGVLSQSPNVVEDNWS
jgi:hypothetical protein